VREGSASKLSSRTANIGPGLDASPVTCDWASSTTLPPLTQPALRRDLAASLAHYGLLERVAVYDSNAATVAAAGNIAAVSELLSMPIEPNHLIDVMPRTR